MRTFFFREGNDVTIYPVLWSSLKMDTPEVRPPKINTLEFFCDVFLHHSKTRHKPDGTCAIWISVIPYS
jgi:hypothetical protein